MKLVVGKDEEGGICLGCIDHPSDRVIPMISGKVLVNLLKAIEEVDNGT